MAWCLFVILLLSPGSPCADAGKPHGHRGLLKAFPNNPPALTLTASEQKTLAAGKAVMSQTEGEAGGRGLAVFLVNAPPELVWKTIGDFASYPAFIPEVKKCEVYKRAGNRIDVAFSVKSFAVGVDYYIRHDFDDSTRTGTWTLDYDRESDLDDSVGFWRVSAVEGNAGQSQVEYSIDIALKGWVPGFIRGVLVDNGVKQATQWVKVQSEKRFAAQ